MMELINPQLIMTIITPLLILVIINFFSFWNIDLVIVIISCSVLLVFLIFSSNPFMVSFFFFDDFSLAMWELSMMVILVCMIKANYNKNIQFVNIIVLLLSLIFFSCSNVLMFFIIFELSLIPIFYMIVGFGNQPERIKAAQYMMMYTLVASSSCFVCLIYIFGNKMEYLMVFYSYKMFDNLNLLLVFGLLLAFLIKVPMFIFHSWLPKAHVEAPLEGSMILAGLMLKMGVFGIFRMLPLIKDFYNSWLMDILLGLSLIGSFLSSWIAMSSDDVKMTVAYSSISHMNFLLASLLTMKFLVCSSSLLISVSHGLCSSMLFYLVTFMYLNSGSRSALINKGFYSMFPSLILFNFISWSLNLSAPPSINFVGEIYMFSMISSLSFSGLIVSFFYILMNSLYSFFNFGLQSYSSVKSDFKNSFFENMYMYVMFFMLFPLVACFFFIDVIL